MKYLPNEIYFGFGRIPSSGDSFSENGLLIPDPFGRPRRFLINPLPCARFIASSTYIPESISCYNSSIIL
jgi:hypothetical protein